MDHNATQMSQSSIPGPSQEEPQPQLQHAEPVPFGMSANPSQYAPPGPAPTAHGMETAVVDAGMGQYGQPPLMPDMTGPVAVPPFAAHLPQPQMAPGPLYYHPLFAPYFPQPQMAPGPLHDPSIPPFQPLFPQMIPGPLYNPFIAPPFVPYFPQPQMMPGPSHHPSAPPPFGYLPQLSDISGAGRKTLTVPPNVQLIVQHGIVQYKCLLTQCKKWGTMERASILKHITSKRHTGDVGQFECEHCGKDLSRSDSLNRHYKSCSKRPKGPGDSTPGSNESSQD